MKPIEISAVTRRRFIMALQGLYPGRRWSGKADIVPAIREIGGLQVDPLNVVARSHDIMLWGRIDGYQMADLDSLLYTERKLFDWGGLLTITPMDELPYWRLPMEQRKGASRLRDLNAAHPAVMRDVLQRIRDEGPLMSKDFGGGVGVVNTGYRNDKATGQALYHLWLTGELMTHSRKGFQRVYDLFERVVPPEHQWVASVEDSERYFARQVWANYGMARAGGFKTALYSALGRTVSRAEADQRLAEMVEAGEIAPVKVPTHKDMYYVRSADLPLLDALIDGRLPAGWPVHGSSTGDEAALLAPLEMVSARGRAKVLFDFEYLWEVYKPAEKRRWGYYTLPILYHDQLVARLDPKLDRASKTLHIKGLWLEPETRLDDDEFRAALGRGLANFMRFVGATTLDVSAVTPDALRVWAEGISRVSPHP